MPNWIKDAILDILSLLIIAIYALTLNNVLEIIIWVYSALLLFSKLLFLSTNFFQIKASKTSVPEYIYHLIYIASILALLYAHNYYLSGLWAIIWILSALPKLKAYYSQKK